MSKETAEATTSAFAKSNTADSCAKNEDEDAKAAAGPQRRIQQDDVIPADMLQSLIMTVMADTNTKNNKGVRRQRNLLEVERRIAFLDAAVAIALTLLVLPLMDSSADLTKEDTAADWLRDNRAEMAAFAISFAVITSSWVDHDGVFQCVGKMTKLLSFLNFVWLLFITFIPVSTNLAQRLDPTERADGLIYIINFLAIKLCILVMTLLIRKDAKDLVRPEYGPPTKRMVVLFSVDLIFLCAALGMASHPDINFWGLFLLVFSRPVTRILCFLFPSLEEKDDIQDEAGENRRDE